MNYAEWGKCGAVKNVRERETDVLDGHNGHKTMGRDGSRFVCPMRKRVRMILRRRDDWLDDGLSLIHI